jgi:hypothetical protein
MLLSQLTCSRHDGASLESEMDVCAEVGKKFTVDASTAPESVINEAMCLYMKS